MVRMNDDVPVCEENRHLNVALRNCRELEKTLQMALVQVMLLNRKYPAYDCDEYTISSPSSAKTPRSYRETPRARHSHIDMERIAEHPVKKRLVSSASATPSASRTLMYCHSGGGGKTGGDVPRECPVRISRSLSSILTNSNELKVQVIKIRRHFEAVLFRVEYLVRLYCKHDLWKPSIGEKRKSDDGLAPGAGAAGYHGCCSARLDWT